MRGRNNEIIDYYNVLQIGPSATDQEIKKAYQARVRALHPDKTKVSNEETNQQLAQVNDAKKMLLNEDPKMNRDTYDYLLKNQKNAKNSAPNESQNKKNPEKTNRPNAGNPDKHEEIFKQAKSLFATLKQDATAQSQANEAMNKLKETKHTFLSSLKDKWKDIATDPNSAHLKSDKSSKDVRKEQKLNSFITVNKSLSEYEKTLQKMVELENSVKNFIVKYETIIKNFKMTGDNPIFQAESLLKDIRDFSNKSAKERSDLLEKLNKDQIKFDDALPKAIARAEEVSFTLFNKNVRQGNVSGALRKLGDNIQEVFWFNEQSSSPKPGNR